MSKVFDFKKQLEFGQQAERDFMEFYHEPLVLATTFAYDFKLVESGNKLELKTDDYCHTKTPNFFFERWSDYHKKKPGGPWQSRKKRADIFCYYFARNNIYYQFDNIKLLCKELDTYIKDNKLGFVMVRNKGWITAGYKIPREAVAHLYEIYEIGEE